MQCVWFGDDCGASTSLHHQGLTIGCSDFFQLEPAKLTRRESLESDNFPRQVAASSPILLPRWPSELFLKMSPHVSRYFQLITSKLLQAMLQCVQCVVHISFVHLILCWRKKTFTRPLPIVAGITKMMRLTLLIGWRRYKEKLISTYTQKVNRNLNIILETQTYNLHHFPLVSKSTDRVEKCPFIGNSRV